MFTNKDSEILLLLLNINFDFSVFFCSLLFIYLHKIEELELFLTVLNFFWTKFSEFFWELFIWLLHFILFVLLIDVKLSKLNFTSSPLLLRRSKILIVEILLVLWPSVTLLLGNCLFNFSSKKSASFPTISFISSSLKSSLSSDSSRFSIGKVINK